MKIVHVGSFDVKTGGPATSAYYTLLGLRRRGVDAGMFMFEVGKDSRIVGTDVPFWTTPAPWDSKLRFAPSFQRNLKRLGPFDLYHAQGIWQWPTYAAVNVARRFGRPYVISPRGMLYPQDIRKSNRKIKLLSLRLRLLKDLNRAACIHATCEDEMVHCRRIGVHAPIAVIPNPTPTPSARFEKDDDVFRVGFVGRLDPRKNVESLIRAMSSVNRSIGRQDSKKAELVIVGAQHEEYTERLRREASRLGVENIRFAGFLTGEEKERAIASFSVLAMPSEFENFGNVIAEGLIRGVPCIATTGSPWRILEEERCGWWVPPSDDKIVEAVLAAFSTPGERLRDMGNKGASFAEKNFSVEAVSEKTLALYEWILGHGPPPSFVHGDR